MEISLPDLIQYKSSFIEQNVNFPLKVVPFESLGLLNKLPKVEISKVGWPWNLETKSNIFESANLWPKLSIVIPSYNQGEYMEECLRSVLLQNYPNLEIIVIDGGSSDKTISILEKYSPWISYWQSKKDKGQGNAINLGFSIASGDYFGWLNSDDFYNKDAFYHLGRAIIDSKKEFYYGDAYTTNDDRSRTTYWRANLVLDRYLRFGGLIASHSAFWKREINVPVWEKMNCNVDGELWIRLVKNRHKKHIKFPLGVVRLQPQSKSSDLQKWKKKWEEDDINIQSVHGNPPAPRSYTNYEYRYLQKIYKLI